MTSRSAESFDGAEPQVLLKQLGVLRRRTRLQRTRAGSVPLLMFGLVLIGADQVLRLDPRVRVIPVGGGFRDAKDQWLSNVAGLPAGRPNLPPSLYWLLAIPTAFALSALWLRREARRRGIAQPWLPAFAAGVLPFALLVVLRLLVEPRWLAVHRLLEHESPSKYLNPLGFLLLGMIAFAASQRNWPLTALCAAIALVNAGLFVLAANGARIGSWREHLLTAVYGTVPGSPLLLCGILLIGAAAWAQFAHRRHTEGSFS